MSRGPRVGDKGTEIILNIVEKGKPIPLAGAFATIQLIRPEVGTLDLEARVEGSAVKYTGKTTDELWPRPGVYMIQATIFWPDGRKFTSESIRQDVH